MHHITVGRYTIAALSVDAALGPITLPYPEGRAMRGRLRPLAMP
jgi:hypothetical protein